MNIKIILGILILLLFCCKTSLQPEQYVKHYKKNKGKFATTVKRNGLIAQISHLPSEFYAARDMLFDSTLTANKALQRYEKSLFFSLSFMPDKEDPVKKNIIRIQRDEMLQKQNLRGTREKSIFIYTKQDTIPLLNFNYEKNWGISSEFTPEIN